MGTEELKDWNIEDWNIEDWNSSLKIVQLAKYRMLKILQLPIEA